MTRVRVAYPILERPDRAHTNAVLAACVYERFGRDEDASREAWKRLLQNDGWDDDEVGKVEFARMIERGQRFLAMTGFYGVR